jgi:hypothetical protein
MKTAKNEVSASVLARHLDVTSKTVAALANAGTVKRTAHGRYNLEQSVRGYVRHLRASGRGPAFEGVTAQRSRLLKLQGDRIEAEIERASSEWVPKVEIGRQWAARFAGIRSAILAWPAGCSAFLDRDTLARLDAEARELLSDIADGKYDVKDDPYARR